MCQAQLNNGQIAQVPLFKLCPNKFSETDSDSRNSNSSMSSQATNEDSDQILSSNDRLSRDETILVSDSASYDHSNEDRNCNDTELFDVCVDCYQMINGLKVSAKNLDLQAAPNNNSETNQTIKQHSSSNQKLTANKNLRTVKLLEPSRHDSPPSVHAADGITMLSLNHISSIQSSSSSRSAMSPYFNKLITSSHHSTPTPPNLPNATAKSSNNLSSIIMNEISSEFDLYDHKQDKSCRQNLTLDLQPVFSKTSSWFFFFFYLAIQIPRF